MEAVRDLLVIRETHDARNGLDERVEGVVARIGGNHGLRERIFRYGYAAHASNTRGGLSNCWNGRKREIGDGAAGNVNLHFGIVIPDARVKRVMSERDARKCEPARTVCYGHKNGALARDMYGDIRHGIA